VKAPDDVFKLALRAAVDGGYLTSRQAYSLSRRLSVDINDLPGREPLDVSIKPEDWQFIFLELLSLALGSSNHNSTWREAQVRIASMTIDERLRTHEKLQDEFEKKNRLLAALWITGAISLATWRTGFWSIVKRLVMSQGLLGGSKIPPLQRIKDILEREAKYVDRFANAIFVGKTVAGENVNLQKPAPASEDAIRSRCDLYSGSARGLFYEEMEAAKPAEFGWLVQYIPKDDGNTCQPCHNAAGYYLSGFGPFPGSICEGGAKCRCVRRPVFLPELYREMVKVSA